MVCVLRGIPHIKTISPRNVDFTSDFDCRGLRDIWCGSVDPSFVRNSSTRLTVLRDRWYWENTSETKNRTFETQDNWTYRNKSNLFTKEVFCFVIRVTKPSTLWTDKIRRVRWLGSSLPPITWLTSLTWIKGSSLTHWRCVAPVPLDTSVPDLQSLKRLCREPFTYRVPFSITFYCRWSHSFLFTKPEEFLPLNPVC